MTAVAISSPLMTLISIHTLRVEGDFNENPEAYKDAMISIHTLRVEGDAAWIGTVTGSGRDFNPHPPRGG